MSHAYQAPWRSIAVIRVPKAGARKRPFLRLCSGLLHKHGMRREVVMPGREVRLATEGASFGPGEFFEVLRFPCRAQLETFWDSAPYRDLVKLREGAMTADALLFE